MAFATCTTLEDAPGRSALGVPNGRRLLKPEHKILGADIAWQVEAVGRNAKRFQLRDGVFGGKRFWGCRVCACSKIDLCLRRS
jgi:hypothetical protein